MATGTTRLADRLAELRDRSFVGRSAELSLFADALRAPEESFSVLFIHGPGGIGKTVLLREFVRIAEASGSTVARLDARDVDPSPAGFLHALRGAVDVTGDDSPIEVLAKQDRSLLVIDTYEVLRPLDNWLREELIPQLPSDALVVIAGRVPPQPAWRADPAWSQLMHVLPLRNLQPEDSRAYLLARKVPHVHHQAVVEFTHGHPLALSLLADMLTNGAQGDPFRPNQAPDVIGSLLCQFVEHVPSPLHWQALAVCAHARVTSEDLLGEIIGTADAAHLFAWLRELPFMEQTPRGIFPHDLAREVLEADLRWRDPPTYEALHTDICDALVRRIPGRKNLEQQNLYFDLMYLVRHSDVTRPFYDWATFGHLYADQANLADYPDIVAMVRHHEGDESARIAEYWLERQPQAFIVFRAAARQVVGFAGILLLESITDADLRIDPAVASAWHYAERRRPLRPGERLMHHRFFVGRDHYQDHATHNMVAMVATMRWMTTPRLAWSFAAVAEPEHWRPMFESVRFPRDEAADFEVGGHRYGVFVHDWRIDPPQVWVHAKVALSPSHAPVPQPPPPLIVLSEPDFVRAVRDALRDFLRPELAHNPLLRSRVVHEHARGEVDAASLQALLREAADELRAHPRDVKLYRCLVTTFFEPVGTQELAAEYLGLPFNTYRYQLAAAIRRLTDTLWQQELRAAAAS